MHIFWNGQINLISISSILSIYELRDVNYNVSFSYHKVENKFIFTIATTMGNRTLEPILPT